jgi:hypothetical protein
MSVARCLEINARLRAAGITVREASGWQSRGNGQTSAYEGGLVHHTATGYGIAVPGTGPGNLLINGRPDLRGPLCNYAVNEDGSITVIAAHPANHAGASGGRSMGPLPTTSLFNRRVLGLEIVYPGTSPMRDAQYRSALVWARVVADVVGRGDIERVRAHAETSITGKWDPGEAPNKTIDMAAFRRAAKALSLEDDMQLTDRVDWDKINGLGPEYLGHKILGTWQHAKAARAEIAGLRAAVDKLAGAVAGDDLTADALRAAVKDGVAEALAEGTVNVDIDITGPGGTNG